MNINDKETQNMANAVRAILEKTNVSEAELVEAVESVDEARRLSSKEEQAVLKLMSTTKTAQEAAKKVEKEMKIPYKEALEIVRKVMKQYESVEEATDLEEASDKEAYKAFFNKAMKKFDIDDITDLKGAKKKEFFDYVDANWKADKEVKESTQIDEAIKPSDLASKYSGQDQIKLTKYLKKVTGAKEVYFDDASLVASMKSAYPSKTTHGSALDPSKKVTVQDLIVAIKSMKEYFKVESTQIDEAFLRLPGEMINGELPMAIRDLESILKGLKAGNDFDEKGFNKQMARLTAVKKAAKKFNSQDEVPTRYQYTKESVEVEDNQLDETKRMKYDKVIKKLKDGDWESSNDVVPKKHLVYIDTKTGKQKTVFVESVER